jgi:small subunit ribosomal protein S5e
MAEPATEIKLFAKWSLDDVEVSDLALVDFLAIKGKNATFVPHTAGKYQRKAFRKAAVRL